MKTVSVIKEVSKAILPLMFGVIVITMLVAAGKQNYIRLSRPYGVTTRTYYNVAFRGGDGGMEAEMKSMLVDGWVVKTTTSPAPYIVVVVYEKQ